MGSVSDSCGFFLDVLMLLACSTHPRPLILVIEMIVVEIHASIFNLTHSHRRTHIYTQSHTQMSYTVVKQRINVTLPWGESLWVADYTGTVNAEGTPHGRGSYVGVEGHCKGHTYDGLIAHGQRDGVGKYTRSGGRWYAGEWKADKVEGFGRSHVCFATVSRSHCLGVVC
jgi:hypothetical protein